MNWEYETESLTDSLSDADPAEQIAERASQGWELACLMTGEVEMHVFKRPVIQGCAGK